MGKLNKLARQNKIQRHSNVYFDGHNVIAQTIYYYSEELDILIYKRVVNCVYTERELQELYAKDDCFVKETDYFICEDTVEETVQQHKVYFRTMRNGHHC